MPKLSGLCKANEHEACSQWLFEDSGKRFLCVCKCHIKVESTLREVDEGAYEIGEDDGA